MNTTGDNVGNAADVKTKGRWRTLFAVGFNNSMDVCEENGTGILFPAYRAALGMNVADLGTLTSIGKVIEAIFGPIWGMVADRFSRKMILTWGAIAWGLLSIWIGFVENFQQLLVLRIIMSIALVSYWGASNSLATDLFPMNERGKAMGILRSFATAVLMLGMLYLSWVVTIPGSGWRIGFISLGVLSILSGLVTAIFAIEPPRGTSDAALAGIAAQAEARYVFGLKSALQVLRIPTMLFVFLDRFLYVPVVTIAGTFFVTWMVDDRHYTTSSAALTMAVMVAGSAAGAFLGGFICDWADRRSKYGRLIAAHASRFLLIPLTYLAFQVVWGDWASLTIAVFMMALCMDFSFGGAIGPIIGAVCLPEQRGTGFSVYRFGHVIFGALLAFLVGIWGTRFGLTTTFFWVVTVWAGASAIAWFGFYFFYPRDKGRQEAILIQRRAELIG